MMGRLSEIDEGHDVREARVVALCGVDANGWGGKRDRHEGVERWPSAFELLQHLAISMGRPAGRVLGDPPSHPGAPDGGLDRAPDDPDLSKIGETFETRPPYPVLKCRLRDHRHACAQQEIENVDERREG